MKNYFKYLVLCSKDEKGAVLILIAFAMVALLGVTALAVDVGMLYESRRQMVTAADAAALAGAKVKALGGSDGEAIAAAESLAFANEADLIHHIAIEVKEYEGQNIKVVVAEIGNQRDLYFARFLGFDKMDVNAYAVATWGYPTSYGNILPIFYIVEEGYDLPDGEQILLGEMMVPGNWGFIDIGQGQSSINYVLAGNDYDAYFEVYEDGEETIAIAETKPGDANSRINAVGERMQKAHDAQDPSIMEGVIPILREITDEGKTEIVIVGFAPFRIRDIIETLVKEDDNYWYSRGHHLALLLEVIINGEVHINTDPVYQSSYDAPIYYGEGHEKRQDVAEFYPRAALLGEFMAEQFIPTSEFSGTLSQSEDYNFGLHVIKLIE